MNSITKQSTGTTAACARHVRAINLQRGFAHILAIFLLLSGLPALSANKTTDSKEAKDSKDSKDAKTSQSSAGGAGWMQDKSKAEKLLHMSDASDSVYLAAKLATPEEIKAARQLLRKSAQELANEPAHAKQVLGQLGKLIGDFAFLQSTANQTNKPSATGPHDATLQNLKEITADYDALIPAAEKQLGASDPQVRSLKTLRATFNQSVNDLKNSQKTQK
jgi:hypothetical protein